MYIHHPSSANPNSTHPTPPVYPPTNLTTFYTLLNTTGSTNNAHHALNYIFKHLNTTNTSTTLTHYNPIQYNLTYPNTKDFKQFNNTTSPTFHSLEPNTFLENVKKFFHSQNFKRMSLAIGCGILGVLVFWYFSCSEFPPPPEKIGKERKGEEIEGREGMLGVVGGKETT